MQEKHRQKSMMHSSKVSIKQSVMGACTNFMYKIGALGGMKIVPNMLKRSSENLEQTVILGKKYYKRTQAEQAMRNLIWFTYRQKIKLTEDLNSDVGWGCLPRVGQMLLAQAIIRNVESSGKIITKSVTKSIIEHFVDNEDQQGAQYSLSNILKYARWKFNVNPGEWFNIGQIAQVIRKIQQQSPMGGTDNLKALFFSQSVIFKNKIVETAGYNTCNCKNKSPLFCINCHPECFQIEQKKQCQPVDSKCENNQNYQFGSQSVSDCMMNQQIKNRFEIIDNTSILKPYHSDQFQVSNTSNQNDTQPKLKNHVLLIVSVRVAEHKISVNDFQSIIQLLSLSTSLGAMGGVPSKALYIVGYEKQEILYLDPHFVQQFVAQENISEFYQTFFCQKYRTLDRQNLDPSMAFCFYLKSVRQVEQLLCKIQELRLLHEKNGQTLFVSTMNEDNFTEQINTYRNSSSFENSLEYKYSQGYNSLQFRDITDSY